MCVCTLETHDRRADSSAYVGRDLLFGLICISVREKYRLKKSKGMECRKIKSNSGHVTFVFTFENVFVFSFVPLKLEFEKKS